MGNAANVVQVEKDGIIDYPLYSGQTLGGVWSVTPNPNGPSVTPNNGFLHYSVNNQPQSDQWLKVSINTPIPTNMGSLLVFRVRANTIQGDEVKFAVAAGVILRFTGGGGSVNWQWWDGSFHTLAPSSIRADGAWHQIVMAFSPGSISLFEDGNYLFTWQQQAGTQVTPTFHMQVLTQGASLSFDVGDIFAVPPSFAPGVDTPWDYSFSAGIWPAPEAMTFRVSDGGPQISFGNGYVRFSASPLGQANTWSFLDLHQSGPVTSILIYRLRVNASGGNETKIVLPGGNILRLTNNGTVASWQYWDGSFNTLATSGIVAGNQDFSIVTLVTTATQMALLENGVYKYHLSYRPVANWNPSLAVQHLDVGTDVSVDVGGIRVLPSIKPQSLLATDLQNELLAYFPLKGSLGNAAGNSSGLVPLGGDPNYVRGPFGLAANFSGQKTVLQVPQLQTSTSPSYTLSTWVLVKNYPPAGKLTAIAGALLLDSDGKLNFNFLFNIQLVYQSQLFKSSAPLGTNQWHNVVITYSYEESRLGIFVDGKIDSIFYLGSTVASASAIVPAFHYVGGFKASFDESFVMLDGAVSDLMFMTQHVHQPTINMLANLRSSNQLETEAMLIAFLIPVFIIILAGVTQVGIEHQMLQQALPTPPPTLEQIVQNIRNIVGVPAAPGAQVSRAQVHIPNDYPILIDVGGEGPLNIGGLVTGFEGAINLNDIVTVQTGGFGPQIGRPIKNIVQVQSWETDPGYPFADNFADKIVMIGAPLTKKNVDEMARVIRNGGEINLWVIDGYLTAIEDLARKLNSVIEVPGEIKEFQNNGVPDNTWFVRRRIIARKS
ncbi:MAG TPA: LamG-like jellyroll fold domain-containing protein [Pyrinomonadaceae bacterium]|nr:LamG-like jellyroll fold domain-containing protein [Pyrinomonadaceae bacterium]